MKISLTNPVDPWHLNQGWGINGEYYRANGINILGHNGLDLQAYHGQPVYASHDGTAFYETDAQGGNGVVIVTNEKFDYKLGPSYFKTVYWHFCDHDKEPKYTSPVYTAQQAGDPRKGTPVKQGDLIGFADSTGLSSGDHVHFALKPIKAGIPTSQDATDMGIGQWVNQEPTNGYLGAIDPTPYLYSNQLIILSTLQKLISLYKKLRGIS